MAMPARWTSAPVRRGCRCRASQLRSIQIEADILGDNHRIADRNRQHFAAHGVTA